MTHKVNASVVRLTDVDENVDEKVDEVELLVWFEGDEEECTNVCIRVPAGSFQLRDLVDVVFRKQESKC